MKNREISQLHYQRHETSASLLACIEEILTQIFLEVLRIPHLDKHARLLEQPLTSIHMQQIIGKIATAFAFMVTPDVISKADSIADLAVSLLGQQVVPGQIAAVIQLHKTLDKRNVAQIETMLRERPIGIQNTVDPLTETHTWVSPLFDRSGYADEARSFLLALDAKGFQCSVAPIELNHDVVSLTSEVRGRLMAMVGREPKAGGVHVNHHFIRGSFFRRAAARLNVVRTMYETDGLPTGWAEACNRMDRVWVPSEFNRETFARAGVKENKLAVVPGTMDFKLYESFPSPLPIDSARGYNFLSVFDWVPRKGWDILLQAFVEEFSPDEDVSLTIKTHSYRGETPRQIETMASNLFETIGFPSERARAKIIFNHDGLPVEQMPRLYRAADCFVLPTRGEGWGRPFMEAMAMGLPVIGTNWSGNTAFMTAENSYLLNYKLAPAADLRYQKYLGYRGHWWAEPDLGHLRELMRSVYTNRESAKAIGMRARAYVTSTFSPEQVAAIISEKMAA